MKRCRCTVGRCVLIPTFSLLPQQVWLLHCKKLKMTPDIAVLILVEVPTAQSVAKLMQDGSTPSLVMFQS